MPVRDPLSGTFSTRETTMKNGSLLLKAASIATTLSLFLAPRPGLAAWPASGRALTTAAGIQQHPAITTDGAGGAIVVWQDLRGPKVNVFARHVLASGELDAAWPAEGRALLTDPATLAADADQESPAIVSD